jgi:uridine phosphorylase
MSIKSSELILNPDGSVYHLNLKPEHIAHDIILGDQNRVEKITHFDSIEFSTQKRIQDPNRYFKGKRITVMSTELVLTILTL